MICFFSAYSCFLVNSADRVIRVYESGEILACGKDGEPEPIQKLQDLVNKWVYNYSEIFYMFVYDFEKCNIHIPEFTGNMYFNK
jgi:hypothetical protein